MSEKTCWHILLVMLSVSLLVSTANVQLAIASGTIYIRADGSIDPSSAPISSADNVTYFFAGDITDSVVIERDNIILDGNGYTLQGSGVGTGVDIGNRYNVTITRTNIAGFGDGIVSYLSSFIVLSENTVTDSVTTGISFTFSSNITITGNVVAYNNFGIDVYWSSFDEIFGNNVTNSRFADVVVERASNNSVIGNNMTNSTSIGLYVYQSSSNVIFQNSLSANNAWGILLSASNNTMLSSNVIAQNMNGIVLSGSNSTRMSGNNITNNDLGGICLEYSYNNSISDNTISATQNGAGISLHCSSSNSLDGNNIGDSEYGLYLENSSDNSIFHNEVIDNYYGILVTLCSENRIYRNNFINNTVQAYKLDDYTDNWDNGYDGNYWTDYAGVDSNSDGIGDTPYVIDGSNIDHYPLMNPYWNPCDVNHDLKIDPQDVMKTTMAFDSSFGKPRWNPHCDINDDGKVNLIDYFAVCKNYGKKYK